MMKQSQHRFQTDLAGKDMHMWCLHAGMSLILMLRFPPTLESLHSCYSSTKKAETVMPSRRDIRCNGKHGTHGGVLLLKYCICHNRSQIPAKRLERWAVRGTIHLLLNALITV